MCNFVRAGPAYLLTGYLVQIWYSRGSFIELLLVILELAHSDLNACPAFPWDVNFRPEYLPASQMTLLVRQLFLASLSELN